MMFDPNNGAVARRTKLLAAMAVAFYLAVVGSFAWVAIHFISKYW
jgi:hypothetical protein